MGRGVDLQFIAGKPEMLAMGVAPALAEKLAPLVGQNKGDPAELAERSRLVLTKAEADSISTIVVNARLTALESLYDQNPAVITAQTQVFAIFTCIRRAILIALITFYSNKHYPEFI